jgi:hypothetical protein
MGSKRVIKAREILNDLSLGMSDEAIMAKYTLTRKDLDGVFEKLVAANRITKEEIEERSRVEPRPDQPEIRRLARTYMDMPLRLFETEKRGTQGGGRIRDISEEGFRVVGLEAKVGEVKEFVVVAHELFQVVYPIVFEAECRWAKLDPSEGWSAGYRITRIPRQSAAELRRIIETISGIWD